MGNQNQSLFQFHPLQNGPGSDVLSIGISSRLVYEGSPCDAFPCWNGGTCVELRRRKGGRRAEEEERRSAGGFSCKCSPFFTGQHCEQRRRTGQKNCLDGGSCPPDTFCWPQSFGECVPIPAQGKEKQQKQVPRDCPLACQNGGICLRLGTAPGHLDCLCLSAFAGPLCQIPSSVSAPLLPGLLLLSLLLFLLALLLLLCHGSTSAGFLLQMTGANKARRDSRKWPLLEWARQEEGEEGDWEDGEAGAEPMSSLEMRECRATTSALFSLKSGVQLAEQNGGRGGRDGPSSNRLVVHI